VSFFERLFPRFRAPPAVQGKPYKPYFKWLKDNYQEVVLNYDGVSVLGTNLIWQVPDGMEYFVDSILHGFNNTLAATHEISYRVFDPNGVNPAWLQWNPNFASWGLIAMMFIPATSMKEQERSFPHMLFVDSGYRIEVTSTVAGEDFFFSIHGWLGAKGVP